MTAQTTFGGYVDFWGEIGETGRTAICGWVAQPFKAAAMAPGLQVRIGLGVDLIETRATGMVFARADVAAIGVGAILVCDVPGSALDGLTWVDIASRARTGRMQIAATTQHLDRDSLREALRPLLERAVPVDHRTVALAGLDTASPRYIGPCGDDVTVSVDEVLSCGQAGILILGTITTNEPGTIQASLSTGPGQMLLPPERVQCGPWSEISTNLLRMSFASLVPRAPADSVPTWLEIRFSDGRVGRASLKSPRHEDGATLRLALAAFGNPRDLDRVFDHVAGPAIGGLHAACRERPVTVERHDLGPQPVAPRVSLLIPLHGRIDYLEVQLALFSAQPCTARAEIIYVVDDPPRQEAALALARSAHARFDTGCRLLLPNRNLGFAAATNVALREASGTYVCFLNSDAFPNSADWLDRLMLRLETDPSLGMVGPLLLLPDGGVQHEGMLLEQLTTHAGWRFPRHKRKGMRPLGEGMVRPDAITGACMVLRRSLAQNLGGFDEGFVIGDFEDADLCARAAQAGFGVAIDRDVRVLHLERKSQGAEAPWRAGATLYNAWLHERRWFSTPAQTTDTDAAPRRRRRA